MKGGGSFYRIFDLKWNKHIFDYSSPYLSLLYISHPQVQRLHRQLSHIWLENWLEFDMEEELCLVEYPEKIQNLFRPPVNCSVCVNVTQVDRVSDLSPEQFSLDYAYSGRPVVVTDATGNWTATERFSFNFFRGIYSKESPVLVNEEEKCQFFPYRTKFENLGEALQMSAARARDPWYIGW